MRVFRLCILLFLALCCLIRLMLVAEAEPSQGNSPIDASERIGSFDTARERAMLVERSPMHSGADVSVVDTSGSPVAGCRALIASQSDGWINLSMAREHGRSSADGVVEVDVSQIPPEASLVLMNDGYRPSVVRDLVPGEARRVVLEAAVELTVALRAASGAPVEGISVEVSVADRGSAAGADPSSDSLRIDDSTGLVLAHKVVTNHRGFARFPGMNPGKCIPRLHLEGTGWVMANSSQAWQWEAPGHVEVVLAEVHAVVARVVGVDVMAASWGQDRFSPFADPGDLRNASLLEAQEGALRKRFPDCFVRAGMLKAGSDGVAALSLTLDGGRMTVHQVQSTPIHQVATPVLLQESPFPGLAGSVVAHFSLPGGVPPPSGIKAAMRWVHRSAVFEVTAEPGREQAVPEGECHVGPAGDAPFWLFESVPCKVNRGQVTVVHIDIPCSLTKTRIRVRLPDGRSPLEAGLSMRFKGEALSRLKHFPSTAFVSVQGGDYAFLSPAEEIDLTAYVKGYGPTRAVVRSGSGSAADHGETFDIIMGQN